MAQHTITLLPQKVPRKDKGSRQVGKAIPGSALWFVGPSVALRHIRVDGQVPGSPAVPLTAGGRGFGGM